MGRLEILNLLHLRTIGCKAYYYLAKERRQNGAKFEDRAKQGILIGYEGNSIYRIYDKERGVVRASAVVFDENDAPHIKVQFNDLFEDTHARGAPRDDHDDTQHKDGTGQRSV